MMKIRYTRSLEDITPEMLAGLHVGWPNPPSPATHLASLAGCNARMLAVDDATRTVAGFLAGMTDGIMILYLWDLEVRPDYQGHRIGTTLVTRLLDAVGPIYQVQLVTDRRTQPFYQKLGFAADDEQLVGMARIDRTLQNGGDNAAD
jgi:GNAT superfamily N-acetyltransferase